MSKSLLKKYLPAFPISLRLRFLLAASFLVLILSLAYGLVAIIGYVIGFDKNTYQIMRAESNLFFTLANWNKDRLSINIPAQMQFNFPTIVFIYNDKGDLLWQLHDIKEIRNKIKPEWLQYSGFHEIDSDRKDTSAAIGTTHDAKYQLSRLQSNYIYTHSVAINRYEATTTLPALTIVVIDSIPQELQHSDIVWSWFSYVLLANLILIFPLLMLAARWSLKPIGTLATDLKELENGKRENLAPNQPIELCALVRNLNLLLNAERQRSTRYHTTLSDLTHSLKTPLAVLQSTLRSLRGAGDGALEEAEPIMLDQISRISQQVGYYLNRSTLKSEHNILSRELHSVPGLLDGLSLALNKVYQYKGVSITLDISPEMTFCGDKDDFMEVLGNILDNACKYCLEFITITARHHKSNLHIFVDDDGPGIPESKREIIFQRGQRADTMRPGQGIGLAVVRDILEGYEGKIIIHSLPEGGNRMEVIFGLQS